MPAIVRQTMSRTLARDLLTDVQNSSNEYYIGIGKCDTFNQADSVIDPVDCLREEREFRNNLQSIKKVEGSTLVVKRVNWSYGSVYSGWDDSVKSDIDENWTPFYVLTDAKEVYVCLSPSFNATGDPVPSIIEPNYGLDADRNADNEAEYWKPFTTSDGYVWKFLYSLTPENIYQFLSSNHMPIQESEDSLAVGDPIEDLQYQVKSSAVGGQIIRARIVTAGTGYSQSNPPTVYIHGDGDGTAAAVSVIDEEGNLVGVNMTNYGSGYTYASFEIVDGSSPSVVEAVVTTMKGLGYDPIDDLKTSSVMVNIKPDGTVADTFIVQNSFRQMGLIKNPLSLDLDTEGNPIPYTNTSAKVLSSLVLVNDSPFDKGKEIVGAQSGARAYVDDSLGNEVFYHQNLSTGFEQFVSGEAVTQTGVVLVGEIDSINLKNVIDRSSGDVLYIENRARIRRDEEQQEDIKIVITV
jgi:hypothetical protein